MLVERREQAIPFDDSMGICLHRYPNYDGDAIYDGNVHTFECTPQHAASNGFYTYWTVRYKLVRKQ